MADEQKRLTLKQERFVTAYLGEAKGNATEAARKAGYSDAENAGWLLRKNAAVSARIEERLEAEALSAGEVLAELKVVAKAPMEQFMQVVRPAMTDEDGVEIAPMQVRLDYGSKVKALELLGKYHKMFTDKVEHGGALKLTDERMDLSKLTDDEIKQLVDLTEKAVQS